MNDLNDALAKGAFGAASDLCKDFVKGLVTVGQKEAGKLSVDLSAGFNKFLERNYRNVSRVKTLLNPSTPVYLETTFESPNLRIEERNLSEDEFIVSLANLRFVVITGIGGSGKSFLLKHIFIRHYNEHLDKIPFFIELRNISQDNSLMEHVQKQIHAISPKFDSELFEYSMTSGKYILLLDGFDEISPDFRSTIEKQILDIAYQYGDNRIIITSRPDQTFDSWNEFYVAEMVGFNKKQALSLIDKLKYDRTIKKQFKALVKDSLYESHLAYLSNPLLCIIMLITFEQGAEIPKKMSVFFGQAFDVLFYKHDATKGTSFRRKFKSAITIDEFRSDLAAFSTFAYLNYGSSFNKNDAMACARQAIEHDRLDEKPDNFLHDLCASVSIIIREGDNYNYVHRSFQEYFVAHFLAYRDFDEWEKLVMHIIETRPNDSVIRLLMEMNMAKFDKRFLLHNLERLCDILNTIDVDKTPMKVFSLLYLGIGVTDTGIRTWTIGRGGVSPQFYYIPDLIRNRPEMSAFHSGPANFNYFACAKALGIGDQELNNTLEIEEVTDSFIALTPLLNDMRAFKKGVLALTDSIRKNIESQKRLVSTTIFLKHHNDFDSPP